MVWISLSRLWYGCILLFNHTTRVLMQSILCFPILQFLTTLAPDASPRTEREATLNRTVTLAPYLLRCTCVLLKSRLVIWACAIGKRSSRLLRREEIPELTAILLNDRHMRQ